MHRNALWRGAAHSDLVTLYAENGESDLVTDHHYFPDFARQNELSDVTPTCLDQQNMTGGIFRKTRCNDTAGGAVADHDVVIGVIAMTPGRPSRSSLRQRLISARQCGE
jgi:hypothetical protein